MKNLSNLTLRVVSPVRHVATYLVRDVPVAVFVRHAGDGRDVADFWRFLSLRDVEAD